MTSDYTRESQNNALLDELSSKVTALRGVTVDIYDQARDHRIIDQSTDVFENMGTSLGNTLGRVKVMAKKGGRMQTLKLAGMVMAGVFVLWLVWGWIF